MDALFSCTPELCLSQVLLFTSLAHISSSWVQWNGHVPWLLGLITREWRDRQPWAWNVEYQNYLRSHEIKYGNQPDESQLSFTTLSMWRVLLLSFRLLVRWQDHLDQLLHLTVIQWLRLCDKHPATSYIFFALVLSISFSIIMNRFIIIP